MDLSSNQLAAEGQTGLAAAAVTPETLGKVSVT